MEELKEFNKIRFIRNIYFLLDSNKDLKIGELEEQIKVSKGYFARFKNDDSAKPSVEIAIKVANRFHVTVDSLLNTELYSMTATERYMYDFFQKLLKDTEADKLEWGLETAEFLNAMRVINGNSTPHPFFFPAMDIVRAMNGKAPKECFFNSHAFKDQTKINGNCYFLRLNNGALLFLADVAKKYQKGKDPENYAKEIWIRKNNGIRFLSSNKNVNFSTIINDLFSAIDSYFNRPRIEEDYRASIDAFMNGEANDHTIKNTTTLFPEEVPL